MAYAGASDHSAEHPLVWVSMGPDSTGFAWSLQQFGLYRRIFVQSQVHSNGITLRKRSSALVGQNLLLDEFPSLGMTNSDGNVALCLNARISGPVLLKRGGVRLATHIKVRYQGPSQTFIVWNSTHPLWNQLPLQFPTARNWNSKKTAELAAITPGNPPADASWDSTLILTGPVTLNGVNHRHSRIFIKGELTLGSGVDLRDCQIVASEVKIEGDATIDGGVVFSAGKMTITGSPKLKGQFISRDTLLLAVQSTLEGFPVFYTEGWNSQTEYQGSMRILEARGEGIFLIDTDLPAVWNSRPNLYIGENTQLTGLVSTDHFMDPRGVFRGSVIGHNLHFQKDGTIWVGHLGYANLGLAPVGTVLGFPAVWDDKQLAKYDHRNWDKE